MVGPGYILLIDNVPHTYNKMYGSLVFFHLRRSAMCKRPIPAEANYDNVACQHCLKPEMWQKVAKFKGAEYFRKALYIIGGVKGKPTKLSETPVTQVINCFLCYRMASGTGAPSLGPKGSLIASTPKP